LRPVHVPLTRSVVLRRNERTAPAARRRRQKRLRRLRARRSRQCPVSVRRSAARAVRNSRAAPCACRHPRPAHARRARSAVPPSSGAPAHAARRACRRHHHLGRKYRLFSHRSHHRPAGRPRPPWWCPRHRSVRPCSIRSAGHAAARATSPTSATPKRRANVCRPTARTTTVWFQHAAGSSRTPEALASRRHHLHRPPEASRPRPEESTCLARMSAICTSCSRPSALSARWSVLRQRTRRRTSAGAIVTVRLVASVSKSTASARVLTHSPRKRSAPARRPPSWWRDRAVPRMRPPPAPAGRPD
jgi:hypothetical protein